MPGPFPFLQKALGTRLSAILDMLLMKQLYEIEDSPNKLNITYAVEYLAQDADLEDYFGWLLMD